MMRNPGFGLDSFYAKGAKGCIVELYQFGCIDEHRNTEIDTMGK